MYRLLKVLPLAAGLTLLPASSASAIDADGYDAESEPESAAGSATTMEAVKAPGSLPANARMPDGSSISTPAENASNTSELPAALPMATSSRSKASMAAVMGPAPKSAKPLAITWECRSPGYGVLSLNEMSFGPECPSDLMPRLNDVFQQCDNECVEVHLPQVAEDAPPGTDRLPYLQGNLQLVFQKLTSPERQVTYYYDNKPVKRYVITCSDKNTENDAERAEYWLDNEPMGTWPEARRKFEAMKWQAHSVAEVKVDFTHPMTATGNGFKGLPIALQKMLDEHGVATNVHMRYREPYVR